MERIGVRELRAGLAAVLRRAEAGELLVVTVDGRAVAQIGPVEASNESLDQLLANGRLIAPRRPERSAEPSDVSLLTGVRIDRALDEIRGR